MLGLPVVLQEKRASPQAFSTVCLNRRQSRDNNTALFVKLSLSSVLFTYVLVKEPHLGSGCVNREFISHLVFQFSLPRIVINSMKRTKELRSCVSFKSNWPLRSNVQFLFYIPMNLFSLIILHRYVEETLSSVNVWSFQSPIERVMG